MVAGGAGQQQVFRLAALKMTTKKCPVASGQSEKEKVFGRCSRASPQDNNEKC
jgi:hypothetical protein